MEGSKSIVFSFLFLKICRQFRHAPSESFCSPDTGGVCLLRGTELVLKYIVT
jgi:hypothetical protein